MLTTLDRDFRYQFYEFLRFTYRLGIYMYVLVHIIEISRERERNRSGNVER